MTIRQMGRAPMTLLDRRTAIVLGILVGAMTLAASVLWVLEPGGAAASPATSAVMLTSLTPPSISPQAALFDNLPGDAPHHWSAIVINPSDSAEGSAEWLGGIHERMGLGGLAYHFVVDNGTRGTPDGQIEGGYRWMRQVDGAYSTGTNGTWYNHNAVGICMIGDVRHKRPDAAQMQALVWLVRELQTRYAIPADHVYVQGGIDNPRDPGLFPIAEFRRQLLVPAVR